MANTVTFEMTENQAQKFEKLLDDTLEVLGRMEKESPEREQRIAESKAETQTMKKEIWENLAILNERSKRLDAVLEKN